MKQYALYWFLVLLILDTLALAFNWKEVHFFLKFALMPFLMVALLHHKRPHTEKNWRVVLAGIITSWAGDVLLLFSVGMELFFLLGLACFLCTHIAYIIYFSRYHHGAGLSIKKHPFITLSVIVYAILLLSILWNDFGKLLIPVIIYTIVISLMMMQAFYAAAFLPKDIGRLFTAGAAIFILSDTLLAINKFHKPFLLANAAIIFTYGIAQALIVSGVICNTDLKAAEVKTVS